MDGKPCSIGLVTYTATIDQKVQFQETKEDERAQRCSNGCNDIRERGSQTKETIS